MASLPIRALAAVLVVAGTFAVPAVAGGSTGESGRSFGVRAVVRTICRAQLDADNATIGDNEISLGRLHELCNNAEGYKVTLIHSPALAGSRVVLDSQDVVLSPTGETVVVHSNQPAFREHQLALVYSGARPANLSFGVRIDPEGMVW